ncbi:MAG TPA: diguanylate cyclase [Chthonomonadaceae bacterium]|nr:diguanylate cyclase [Chthonomonadaceae bacterium]
MKVLIAEDDRVSAMVLRKTLERLGHEVTVAADGKQAWECLKRTYMPLVITDWMMPDIDGLELCRRVRSLSRQPYTYVMLLTARDQRADRLEGLGAGADDFLIKPLDPDELTARLKTAERILDMQAELRGLHEDLEQQNRQLADMMDYLKVANHRFGELFNGMPIPCFTYDAEGRIQEWNRAFETLFDLTAKQILHRFIWQTLDCSGSKEEIQDIVRRVFAGEAFTGLERSYQRADGTVTEVEWTTFPALTPEGRVVGSISAAVDVSQRKRYERELEAQMRLLTESQRELEMANTKLRDLVAQDGLTGLFNHRAFHERLETEFTRAHRYEAPLSLVLLDLDKFKGYNDSFGHLEGDGALRRVAALLLANVRVVDVVARYGGEEFAILLPQSCKEEALRAAERMRKAIETADWSLRSMTGSFGVSTLSSQAQDYRQLLREADEALYYSKSQGRNTVSHFDDLHSLADAA